MIGDQLKVIGAHSHREGLVFVLLRIGGMKYAADKADEISPSHQRTSSGVASSTFRSQLPRRGGPRLLRRPAPPFSPCCRWPNRTPPAPCPCFRSRQLSLGGYGLRRMMVGCSGLIDKRAQA